MTPEVQRPERVRLLIEQLNPQGEVSTIKGERYTVGLGDYHLVGEGPGADVVAVRGLEADLFFIDRTLDEVADGIEKFATNMPGFSARTTLINGKVQTLPGYGWIHAAGYEKMQRRPTKNSEN